MTDTVTLAQAQQFAGTADIGLLEHAITSGGSWAPELR